MIKSAKESIWVNNTDYKNVGALLNTLVGLGLLAGGAGMTARGVQSLRNRVTELPIAITRRPSRFVQKQDRLRKILLDPKYTAPVTEEESLEQNKSASVNVNRYCTLLEKKADSSFWEGLSMLWPGNWGGMAERGASTAGRTLGEWLWDATAGTTTVDVHDPEIRKRYSEIPADAPLGDRIKAQLAAKPGLRSLWFLPGATAAIGLGYMGGDQLMSKLDDMLGSAKMRSEYKNKAEKIYQKSVKYLQDVAAGRVKREAPAEEQVKESSFTKQADPKYVSSGNGVSGFVLHPNFLLALILAGLTAKQIKGGIRGFDAAKRELADRTHLQRAFQAARREREGDYNGLHLEMDPEPVLTPHDKSLSRKSNKLVADTEKNLDPMLRYENYQMERIRSKQNSLW